MVSRQTPAYSGVADDPRLLAIDHEPIVVWRLVEQRCSIRHRRLPEELACYHASSKADTDQRRRVLHIEYADSLDMGSGLELAIA
jgi:hypothetical protein